MSVANNDNCKHLTIFGNLCSKKEEGYPRLMGLGCMPMTVTRADINLGFFYKK